MQEVGRRVRELRDSRGWSLRQLAERAEVSHAWIAGVEGGLREKIDIARLGKLAAALGVSVEDLVGHTGERERTPEEKAALEKSADEIAAQWLALGDGERELVRDFMKLVKGRAGGSGK